MDLRQEPIFEGMKFVSTKIFRKSIDNNHFY